MNKITTMDIERVVARHFNPRINIIIPNVSWGFGLSYEADLICVSPSGYATEIEIKVTASDIRAEDKKSKLAHRSYKIKRFYYAVPSYLKANEDLPKDCGLLCVDENYYCKQIRPPRVNKDARRLEPDEINKLLQLGCMRIWGLKESLFYSRQRIQKLKEQP